MSSLFYKEIRQSASNMIAAAQANDVRTFEDLYDELKKLCSDNKQSENNHPSQWETLADFTDDPIAAIDLYNEAIAIAESMNAVEYRASINYALADRYHELGDVKTALIYAQQAKELAGGIDEAELLDEIEVLLKELTESLN